MNMKIKINPYVTYTKIAAIVFCFITAIGVMFVNTDYPSSYYLYISFILISTLIMALHERVRTDFEELLFFWIAIIVASLLMALRAQTGLDDLTYLRIFEESQGKSLSEYVLDHIGIEAGYTTLNYVIYQFSGGDYNSFQIFITLFTFLIWGKAIWLYRKIASESTMLLLLWTQYYYLIMAAALIRIFIAIALSLIAIYYVIENKPRSFVLMIIIASLFHRSALILLMLLVFFVNKDWAKRKWKLIAIALLVSAPIGMYFAGKVLAPLLGSRYVKYTALGSFTISLSSLDVLPVLLLCLFCLPDVSFEARKYYVMGLCLMCASIVISIFTSVIGVGRIVYYTNLGILIDISILMKTDYRYKSHYVVPIVLIAYSAVYLIHAGLNQPLHMDALFPYRSIIL